MQIAIVGCGWLGLPLGLSLQKSGHSIVATKRSESGCKHLSEQGIHALCFELGMQLTAPKLKAIFASELLILNIPVGRKTPAAEQFVKNVKNLLEQAKFGQVQQVIFISTISVYGDSNRVVTEASSVDPTTDSAHKNLEIEQLVKKNFGHNACILRLAGLVGDNRHPANHLAGKTALAKPNQVVNLIHQQDVIQAVNQIIKRKLWPSTLHLSASEHPARAEYYCWAAKKMGLTAPIFAEDNENAKGKIVDATESLRTLGMNLVYPNPYAMLSDVGLS